MTKEKENRFISLILQKEEEGMLNPMHPRNKLFRIILHGLRSQIGTLKKGGHSKYLSYAFTERGVAMLSSVLDSKEAVQVKVDCESNTF